MCFHGSTTRSLIEPRLGRDEQIKANRCRERLGSIGDVNPDSGSVVYFAPEVIKSQKGPHSLSLRKRVSMPKASKHSSVADITATVRKVFRRVGCCTVGPRTDTFVFVAQNLLNHSCVLGLAEFAEYIAGPLT